MPKNHTHADDIMLNERTELNYFLGNPPSWMLQNGIIMVALFFGLLLALSYLIKYPDTVACRVVLTTENPPIRLMAQATGRISDLLVKENDSVEAGQILAVFENTADWRDVLRLETMLSQNTPLSTLPPQGLKLGSLQTIYSTFTQNAKDFAYFTSSNGVATKIEHLNRQIEGLRALNQNLVKQKDIQAKEYALTEHDVNRQKQLHTEGVISDMDFEKFQSQQLQQSRQIEATEANFINNDMQARQLESQINDLSQAKNDNQNTKELTAAEDIRRLLTAIADWKRQNLIIAPIAGKVTLSKIWSPKQAVTGGDELLIVCPQPPKGALLNAKVPFGGWGQVIGKATMPVANSGKVRIGLPTKMQLDNFPYTEYGILEGTVQRISLVPQKDNYLVEIKIASYLARADSLRTTYGKFVPFQQEIQGAANIITEDRRVVERLLDKWRDLLKNRR